MLEILIVLMEISEAGRQELEALFITWLYYMAATSSGQVR